MMHRRLAAAALALVSLVAPPATASAPPVDVTPAVAAHLDTALQVLTGSAKGLTPALSVAVAENGRIVYARAFGVSDVVAKTPATPETRFRIASVTKVFTAVCVMQLVEAGRMRLDAPLAAYLPWAPHAAEVTIRELLNHTSGMWNYGDEVFSDGRVASPTTPRAIVAAAAQRPLERKPGSAFAYSNTGYVLLGLAVEAVSHRSLAEYEREHVLRPAKMTATTFGEAPPGTPFARGYMDAAGTAPPAYSPTWFYADGDIVSTASDLARFDAALMDGRLVKPATFAAMQANGVPTPPSFGKGTRYGLGLTLIPLAGETLVEHHGGVPGFAAETQMLPRKRYAIVVLSNAYDFVTARADNAVLQETLPDVYAQALKAALAGAAVTTAAPGIPDDPVASAALRTFVAGIQRGTVDPATLNDAMKAALTPQSVSAVGAQLAPLGSLQSLTLRRKEQAEGLTSFHYAAAFAGGQTLALTIALDKDGKIAGFFFG
jgi:CubicO group peptidase (beta-lactamase class C family)